jgi:hypothetical protein
VGRTPASGGGVGGTRAGTYPGELLTRTQRVPE